MTNLLVNMQTKPTLAPLYDGLSRAIEAYDDCLRTCDIPFTKKSHHDSQHHGRSMLKQLEDILAIRLLSSYERWVNVAMVTYFCL